MTGKEQHIAQLIGSRIQQTDPNAEVILLGSHARGQANDESDWDILILMDHPKQNRSDEDIYRNTLFQLELELGEAISTFVYAKADWEKLYSHTPLYKNIQQEGVKLKTQWRQHALCDGTTQYVTKNSYKGSDSAAPPLKLRRTRLA